jgi:hypothetical protein
VTSERPDLPHEIDRVVGRAMAKSPDDRPRSGGELADDAAEPSARSCRRGQHC